MKFVGLLLFSFVATSTSALECYECTGRSADECYPRSVVTCSGSCYYTLGVGIYDQSVRSFVRGCIDLGNVRLDGCGDALISYSGITMNQRLCYCTEDSCNDKPIYSVNSVLDKAIQCYKCSGAECGYSSRTVSCDGACALGKTYNGEVSKSCVKHNDNFGTGGSIGFDYKFTGCVATGYGVSRSDVYMCHDDFCNNDDQYPCKFTTGAPEVSYRDSVNSLPPTLVTTKISATARTTFRVNIQPVDQTLAPGIQGIQSIDPGYQLEQQVSVAHITNTSGAPCMWSVTPLAILIAIAAALTI